MDRWMDHYGYHGPYATAERFANRIDMASRRRTGRELPLPVWHAVRGEATAALTMLVLTASLYHWLNGVDRRILEWFSDLADGRH